MRTWRAAFHRRQIRDGIDEFCGRIRRRERDERVEGRRRVAVPDDGRAVARGGEDKGVARGRDASDLFMIDDQYTDSDRRVVALTSCWWTLSWAERAKTIVQDRMLARRA